MLRALGVLCYAIIMIGVGFYVGWRHGQIAGEDTTTGVSRRRGVIVRSLVSLFLIVGGGGLITLLFWDFLYGVHRR